MLPIQVCREGRKDHNGIARVFRRLFVRAYSRGTRCHVYSVKSGKEHDASPARHQTFASIGMTFQKKGGEVEDFSDETHFVFGFNGDKSFTSVLPFSSLDGAKELRIRTILSRSS